MDMDKQHHRKKDVDGGWAWVVLGGSFMNLLLSSGVAFVSGIFQKLFLEQFGESVAFTAWVTAIFSSFMQLAGPLSGMMTSASNCRVTVMVGGALLTVGLAASTFATSLQFLFVTFGLIAGIGLGLMYSPSIVIVNFFFDRRRTVVMGVALSASGIGIIGSPVLSRYLIDEFSWRETMMILAGITAHVCIFGAIMFPVHEPPSKCLRLFSRCFSHVRTDTADGNQCDGRKNGGIKHADKHSVSVTQDSVKCENHVDNSSPEMKDSGEIGCTSIQKINDSVKDKIEDDNAAEDALLLDHLESPRKVDGNNHIRKPDSIKHLEDSSQRSQSQTTSDNKRCSQTTNGGENLIELAQLSHQHPTDSNNPAQNPESAENMTDSAQLLPTHPTSPDQQFGSRKSLNKISHQLNGTRTFQILHDDAQRVISHSSHNLTRIPQSHPPHRPYPHHSHAHLPHHFMKNAGQHHANLGEKSTNSKLDVRAIATYSSIQSLHSVGLPTAEQLVKLSPGAGEVVGDSGGESGEGGVGGSDWLIFKNVPFLFLCVNLFLSNMACGIFNIHLPAFSQQRGLDDYDITFVLAIDGLAVFLSRILVGALGHDENVDKLAVYFGLHLIASFVQAAIPVSTDLASLTFFTFLMGTYYGSVYSLLTSLTISIVGLPALAFAFGVEMISAGLGYLVAPPLAGWIVDETGNYDNSMYLGGLLMFISALALLCLTCGRPPGAPPIGYVPPPPDTQIDMEADLQCDLDS